METPGVGVLPDKRSVTVMTGDAYRRCIQSPHRRLNAWYLLLDSEVSLASVSRLLKRNNYAGNGVWLKTLYFVIEK